MVGLTQSSGKLPARGHCTGKQKWRPCQRLRAPLFEVLLDYGRLRRFVALSASATASMDLPEAAMRLKAAMPRP